MISPDQIAHYLEEHPNFFREYPYLLNALQVDHPHGGKLTSITEHHLVNLRDKNRSLEDNLQTLIANATANEKITQSLHLLTLDMLMANGLDQLLQQIQQHLQEDFALPYIGLRFWNAPLEAVILPEFADISAVYQSFADTLTKPYCGATHGLNLSSWFGDDAGDQVLSQALIPLKYMNQSFGLFALGSDDAERFQESMGTLFLERLGELFSAALCIYFPLEQNGNMVTPDFMPHSIAEHLNTPFAVDTHAEVAEPTEITETAETVEAVVDGTEYAEVAETAESAVNMAAFDAAMPVDAYEAPATASVDTPDDAPASQFASLPEDDSQRRPPPNLYSIRSPFKKF